jgi:hypothetical protein
MMDLNIHLHQVVAQEKHRADGKHPEISSDTKEDCRFLPWLAKNGAQATDASETNATACS